LNKKRFWIVTGYAGKTNFIDTRDPCMDNIGLFLFSILLKISAE